MSVYVMFWLGEVEQAKDELLDEPLVAKRRVVVGKRRSIEQDNSHRGKPRSAPPVRSTAAYQVSRAASRAGRCRSRCRPAQLGSTTAEPGPLPSCANSGPGQAPKCPAKAKEAATNPDAMLELLIGEDDELAVHGLQLVALKEVNRKQAH